MELPGVKWSMHGDLAQLNLKIIIKNQAGIMFRNLVLIRSKLDSSLYLSKFPEDLPEKNRPYIYLTSSVLLNR